MDEATKAVMIACTTRSDENNVTFPEVVGLLMEAGVERYHADLSRAEKTYYMPDGASFVTPSAPITRAATQAFSPQGVSDAVRSIQQGRIDYAEFCRRIVAAGCVEYVVSLAGRRAVYSGRTGESYVELFPSASP
jgi:uncharacterized protein YbcV (DUF1398 family)